MKRFVVTRNGKPINIFFKDKETAEAYVEIGLERALDSFAAHNVLTKHDERILYDVFHSDVREVKVTYV